MFFLKWRCQVPESISLLFNFCAVYIVKSSYSNGMAARNLVPPDVCFTSKAASSDVFSLC